MTRTTVLVVGCAPGSFGDKLFDAFKVEMGEAVHDDYSDWRLVASGLPEGAFGKGEWLDYDASWPLAKHMQVMQATRPHIVVYCAGTNFTDEKGGLYLSAELHMRTNVLGFMHVAEAFKQYGNRGGQLIAISSNSARIPRSPSLGYCMSKAALSMAVRVLARRWKGNPIVWGVEPGLMDTTATIMAVDRSTYSGRAHRMVGVTSPYGLNAEQVAETVARTALWGGVQLNGTLMQLDAGEL